MWTASPWFRRTLFALLVLYTIFTGLRVFCNSKSDSLSNTRIYGMPLNKRRMESAFVTDSNETTISHWLHRYRSQFPDAAFQTRHLQILNVTISETTAGPLPPTFFDGPVERHVSVIIESYVKHFISLYGHSFPSNVIALDLGANAGYFTQVLAVMGIPVHSYDPSPDCCALVAAGAAVNGFTNVHIHHRGVSSRRYAFDAPSVCDAGFQFKDMGKNERVGTSVRAEPVSVFESEDVVCLFAKMDTEGSEIDILHSLSDVWQQRRIRALVIELAPHVWASKGYSADNGISVLEAMIKSGYRMYLLTEDPVVIDVSDLVVAADPPVANMTTVVPWKQMHLENVRPFIQRLMGRSGFNILMSDASL